MGHLGKYWLFFVIVAVGLALSWGQVGRNAQQVLQENPTVYLTAEQGCAPVNAPCAAVASDRALVLGPNDGGLRLRQTGFDTADIIKVEAQVLASDSSVIDERQLVNVGKDWVFDKVQAVNGAVLRIRVIGNRDVSVADFPY